MIDSPSGSDRSVLSEELSPLGSACVQPQLSDGSMVWLPAKRNVYTNTHNCSVRSHSELTTQRRGALLRCCDFGETGVQSSSGKQALRQDGS